MYGRFSDRDTIRNVYRIPSTDGSYHVAVGQAVSEGKPLFFLEIDLPERRIVDGA
jgi:hypothetical protein